MTRRRAACALVLLFLPLLALAFFACGGPAFTAAAGQDGGAPDVVTTVDGAAPDASAVDSSLLSLEAGVGRIVYVSAATGSDLNDGLSQSSPKKSLVSAIAVAALIDGGAEVHACAGTYPETSLVLGAAVSVRGAYSCATWTRTATFGYPTFDHVNVTLVQNADPTSQAETMLINGSVPSTTTVEGLAIEGASTFTGGTTTGLIIRSSASPLLTDDAITGGGGHPAAGDGSIGLWIFDSASPEVRHCAINGGTGTGGIGSMGVQINSTGAPNVHDNFVSGGLGTSTNVVASRGMQIESSLAAANALANNVVSACDAPGVSGWTAGIRVAALDASTAIAVDIVGSQVNGCNGTEDGGTSFGIQVDSPGANVRMIGDRVYGGSRGGSAAFTAGVIVEAAGSIEVVNSMVHAGDVAGPGSASDGISIGPVAAPSIVYDTVYAGAQSGTPIVLLSGESNARITDVILLGAGPILPRPPAIFAQSCTGAVASIDHTLFANFGLDLYDCNSSDGGAAATISALQALLSPAVAFSDLVYAQQSVCDDDAGCVVTAACPGTPTACLGTLFGASWTADDGVTGLFQSTAPDGGTLVGGWTLPAGTPCSIARGGTPVTGVATDLYDVPRSSTTPTLGAAELTAACSP